MRFEPSFKSFTRRLRKLVTIVRKSLATITIWEFSEKMFPFARNVNDVVHGGAF